jgi:hypothetical protein
MHWIPAFAGMTINSFASFLDLNRRYNVKKGSKLIITLASFRRDVFEFLDHGADFVGCEGRIHPFGGGGLSFEGNAGAVFDGWSQWAHGKAATTVGTDVLQGPINTVGAEGAFVGANAGVYRIGWEIFVAEFAVGP